MQQAFFVSRNWKITRVISSGGKAEGEVVFSPLSKNIWLYKENGTLSVAGYTNEFFRSYIYEFRGKKIVIFYNDPHRKGDVLHELELTDEDGVISAQHCHVCGNDTYHLTFTMQERGNICMDYVVKGPQKDYQMKTVLTPMAA